jgi:hypothetical protein
MNDTPPKDHMDPQKAQTEQAFLDQSRQLLKAKRYGDDFCHTDLLLAAMPTTR